MTEVTSHPFALACVLAVALLFLVLELRRFFRQQRRDKAVSAMNKHGWARWHWSQDGWVRYCKICPAIQYGGDDYGAGPDNGGAVVLL